MKRLTTLFGAALMLTGSACADPPASLLVTGHQVMEGSVEDGQITECEFPDTIGEGIVFQDVFINLEEVEDTGFQLGLLMENRLEDSSQYAPIGEDVNQRLDQNHIEIQGYEVTFDEDEDGFGTLGSDGELRYEATGIVPTEGVLYARVTLFEPNEIQAWRDAFSIAANNEDNVIVPSFAEVQVVGRTVGGDNVESNRLTIPIQVCDGCNQTTTPICVATD